MRIEKASPSTSDIWSSQPEKKTPLQRPSVLPGILIDSTHFNIFCISDHNLEMTGSQYQSQPSSDAKRMHPLVIFESVRLARVSLISI